MLCVPNLIIVVLLLIILETKMLFHVTLPLHSIESQSPLHSICNAVWDGVCMTSTVKKCKSRVCIIKKHLGRGHLEIVIEIIMLLTNLTLWHWVHVNLHVNNYYLHTCVCLISFSIPLLLGCHETLRNVSQDWLRKWCTSNSNNGP